MIKKIGIIAGIAVIIILIIIILFLGKRGELPFVSKKNMKKTENIELTQEDKIELQNELEKSDKVKKKYNGVEGDKAPAAVTSVTLSALTLDIEKKQYIKVKMDINDESGVYRIRVLFFYDGKQIGYMQQNPNTKEKSIKGEFEINEKTILDNLKTFKDFEGAEIKYAVNIWDNNMNLSEYKPEKGFYVKDNIPPQKIKANWTVFYNDNNADIEIYTNKLKTKFLVYKIEDLPLLKENIIKKYEYGYTSLASGELLLRVGMEPFAEERKEIEIEAAAEGKYQFFIRAYDLQGNFSEKKIKFYIDTTPPSGEIGIEQGMEFYTGEKVNVILRGSDALSGIFRYRMAGDLNALMASEWQEYKDINAPFNVPAQEGFYEVWAQLEDNAFNMSEPFKVNYYAKVRTTIGINAQDKSKERIIEYDKSGLNKGKLEIKKYQEK